MRSRALGVLSAICLVLTTLWLAFRIAGRVTTGPLETFDQVLAWVARGGGLFYLTYTNVALVTVSAVALFAALYLHYERVAPVWSTVGVAFVPIYGALALVAYLSQITVVPRLLELEARPEHRAMAEALLRQAIQEWPDSAVFAVNNLAYAVLGLPSLIFGVLMLRSAPALRLAGALLALNGVACIVGFVGIAARHVWLAQGSLVGGVLFLLALVSMSRAFLRREPGPSP